MLRFVVVAAALIAVPAVAATTLDFEAYAGLPDYENQIDTVYDGFTFSNVYAMDTSRFPVAAGYLHAATSGTAVAYNGDGRRGLALSAAAPFSLTSAYLTAAWNDGLTITVTGTLAGKTVFTRTVTANTDEPVFATFDSDPVDSIAFSSSGGTPNAAFFPSGGRGTQFALDDLTINGVTGSGTGNTVPEPASWALMVAGFGVVGAGLRRRHVPAAA